MEEKDNNNQQVTEIEEVLPWDIKNPLLREAKQSAVKSICQQITGVNAKTWFELEKKGVIPTSGTYEEYIQKIVKYYQQRQEVSLEKVRLEAEKAATEPKSKRVVFDTESGLSPVMEADIIQKIRVNKAREKQIHLANLQTSREMLSKQHLIDLTSPMLGNIANMLRQTAEEEPPLQKVIDKCLDSIHKLGLTLMEQCQADEAAYIDLLLQTPVDINLMLESDINVY